MAQRYDIVRIDFQANAGKANVAIESLRKTADGCNTKIKELQRTLKEQKASNATEKEIEKTRALIAEQQKLYKVYDKGYNELIKGMRVLDQGVKAFNDGTLAQMSAAFQKTLYNAAKLTRTKLAPDTKTYREDFQQLTALMNAAQTNFAKLQTDAQQMLETLRNGGKVSTAALNEELKAQRELLSVMSETDKGYKQTQRNVAELDLYLKKMGGDFEFIRQNISDTKKVSDDMLRNMYTELERVNQEGKVTQKIMQDNATAMKEIRTEQARRVENVLGGNLGQQSEQSIRTAIANAKELLFTYKTNSKEAQTLSSQIVNAEEHLKAHGIEAARAAQRETQQIKTQEEAEKQLQATMNKRLRSLSSLSAEALSETRKYWEAQVTGADRGSTELKKYEANLQKIIRQERERKVAQLDGVLKNPSGYGVAEVRNAVQEMEKLRDSVAKTNPQWAHFNKMVEQGKTYLDQLAKTEAAQKIASQMQNLTTLSAQGLAEVKKYWETMVAGAAHGSTELTTYEAKLKQVTAEEQRRAELQAQSKVSILGGNLGQYSEAEIRKAIEAGQQLIQTYKTADPEAKKLAQNIVAAEQHLKQYGIEAERTALREAEALRKAAEQRKQNDALMKQQLQQGTSLSQSALKAQEQYWQRLIDDPKTAVASLQEYKNNLQQVKTLQEQMAAETIKTQGQKALAFFRGDTSNASADMIKQQTEALKKYRDSLPRQDQAALIQEIDSYILKTGESAKVAAGEWMSYADAEKFAESIGTDGFIATSDQLQKATQSLTRYRDTLIKTIQQKREDGAATAEEEAELKKVEAELKKMKFEMDNANMSSKRMHEILKDPSSAKNLDELSAAIKRSTQELKLMEETIGKDNAKYKEMAEQTKKATIAQKEMEAQFKASASSFEKAWSRLKTYIGLYVGAAVAMQKIVVTMGDLMELSDKMGEVRKTTGFTADEVGRLSTALANMDTRTSLTGLMELSAVAGQLGLKTEQEVRGFTEAANILMVALPEMGKEGATAMLKVALATGEIEKIRQQMQDGLIEGGDAVSVAMTKIGSTIDSLRANSAAAAPAITDFVKRVGAVGAQSGITIDQVAALGSTVDALGMRVEMSATALSRMIPAIRNNAFEIGKTIGLSQERIEEMYKEGRAMEVIIMLLEKMRGMTAEDIESKLSTGGMADVLKDLNQQGARAGIVFAGLSQNVDELKRQLGVAKTAYEENIAIQNEYNKMNETTAAKWARLKNQLEELFIGDVAQRWLGGVIDRLRQLLDLAIKYEAYVKSFITYLVLLRMGIGELITIKFTGWLVTVLNGFGSFITGLRGMVAGTTSLKTAWSGLTKAMNANVFVAVASALAMLAHQLWDVHNEAKQAALEMERVLEQTNEERVAVEKLFKPLRDANLQEEEKRKLIAAINNQYGTYLSKMLSEASNAQEIARAYEAINLQLQKKNILEGIEANNRRIRDKAQGDLNDSAKDLRERIGMSAPKSNIPEIREAIMDVIKEFETTNILATDPNNPKRYGKDYTRWDTRITGVLRELWQGGKFDKDITEADFSNIKRQALDYWKELYGVQKKQTDANQYLQDELDYIIGKARTAANKDIPELISDFDKAIGKHDGNVKNYSADESKAVITAFDAIKAYYELHKDELNQEQLKKINKKLETSVDEFRKKAAAAGGGGGKGINTNPYGNAPAADSTEYSTWNVEELVFRRKQMDKYKNVLKPGVEVREVLSQDKALMKALDNGLKDDWQSVLGWYNQERLKIQKELKSERFSTNEGHWLDERNKGRKNKQPESDYALAELDRYYLRRKQAMEKARSEEKITEEMYNRQVELLEQEHLKKRSDLRGTFTGELGEKETEQFRKWWKGLEKQYELDDVSWKTVESEWSKATAAQIGRNNQRMQKDLTDQQAIVMKHMNTIAGIIAQERPYDGITKNLQDNLTKIDVLFADFGVIPNEQIENGSLFEENSKRLAFLLGEAERAYTLTAEELTTDMRKAGFDAWADALDEQAKQRLLAQLQSTYDKIQEAIKKEAAQIKKEVDIWWSDIATGEKQSRKDTFEKALSNLGLWEDGVKRANSLIGAGVASERVADKLAIKQMQIRLAMQATYFAKMREVGELEIQRLQEAGKLQDAEHLRKSLNLSLTQEQVKLDEQRVAIANKLEESQNRLYTQMHEYADLLYNSMQSLFEASNTGNAEFYNERAKLQLTGGDGTAKQYIVIDNAGTEDAEAHYEYLTEMEALERQHEIDQQNASAEAWRKVMDDVNAKINEMITDQMNAMLQDAAINDNTAATNANTEALIALTSSIGGGKDGDMPGIDTTFGSGLNLGDIMSGSDNGAGSDKDKKLNPSIDIGPLNRLDFDDYDTPSQGSGGNNPSYLYDWSGNSGSGDWASWRIEQNNAYTENAIENAGKRQEAETKADKKMTATAQSAFAKMTQAANLYGIAYQVMSNDNMTAAQKFGMIAVQAAGNAAITALTVNMSETAAQTASDTPSVFSKLWKQLGWGAIPVFALFTGLLGGLMGLAASAITKSKSQIAQATGVSASQGRLATGMLTYAEGNVNEFTDPGSLTPGRHYNVDAADGKSYRAKYMGTNPKTHITNGPEFHLAGEAGREAIIDAHTTRLLQMDDNGIWSAIQTLYNGGSLRHSSRRGRGVRAFASGNLEELEEMDNGQWTMDNGMDNGMDIAAMTDALNRQTAVQEALLERLSSPIQATFNVYGKGGLVDSYDTGKKTVNRHGVKY